MDTQKIDWTQPLEAVHMDGRIVSVETWGGVDSCGDCVTKPKIDGVEGIWRSDGTPWGVDYTGREAMKHWRLRNVAPKEVEWGPEIEVFKEKPWFIKPDTVFEYKTPTCLGDCWHSWLAPDWESVVAVRLKVNHPYYDNTQTHTYTVASEDEAALNASRPTRTALEQRMEDLVRRMAKTGGGNMSADYAEARAILAELDPVDPMLLEARKIVADQYGDSNNVSHLRAAALSGDGDEWFHTKVAIAALSRGRALERGE